MKGPSEEDAMKAIEGMTPYEILEKGAQFGSLIIVKIAEKRGACIRTDNGGWAIQYAAENGYLDIVKYLVERGANIHVYNDFPLRSAANGGHLDIVKYLAEKGANTYARNNEAVRMAAVAGHADIVKYLESKFYTTIKAPPITGKYLINEK